MKTIAPLLLCAAALGASVPEDHRAPAPVLGAGRPVAMSATWHTVDATGKTAPAPGRIMPRGTAAIRIETRPAVTVTPWHVYRLAIPVRGGSALAVEAGLCTVDGAPERFMVWPRRHHGAANALSPGGTTVTGYCVIPPGGDRHVVAYVSCRYPNAGHRPVHVGTPRLVDLGPVPARPGTVLLADGFDHWTDAGMPYGHHVVFAKPKQFVPAHQGMHAGRSAAHNRQGRALLFGPHLPCRFASVVRIRVWARGTGRVHVWATPYVARTGRCTPCRTGTFAIDGDWRPCELVVGQHVPEADHLVPTIDVHGPIALDSLTVERLAE